MNLRHFVENIHDFGTSRCCYHDRKDQSFLKESAILSFGQFPSLTKRSWHLGGGADDEARKGKVGVAAEGGRQN